MNWKGLKNRLFSRKTGTFILFLLISAILWLMYTVGTKHSIQTKVQVVYWGLPDDVKLEKELPSVIEFTIKEEGNQLVNYFFKELDTLEIDLSGQFVKNRHSEVKVNFEPYIEDLLRPISSTFEVIDIQPASYVSKYINVYTRRVPIVLKNQIVLGPQFTLTDSVELDPATVLIRGERRLIDSIKYIYADTLAETVEKSGRRTVELIRPKGVELLRTNTTLNIQIERITEKTFTVPLVLMNVPKGVTAKTFPAEVSLIAVVGLSKFKTLEENDFSIVADYDLRNEISHTIPLYLEGNEELDGLQYKIVPAEVEYILEY